MQLSILSTSNFKGMFFRIIIVITVVAMINSLVQNSTTTDIEGDSTNSTATGIEGNSTATDVEGNSTATDVEGNSTATGIEGNTSFATGIFNGWVADPLQFPYHALISCLNNDGLRLAICNGAIINNRFVITSARCIYSYSYYCNNSNYFQITVGTIVHPFNTSLGLPREYTTKPGREPYYAPGYIPGYMEHDLALLETDEPIIFSEYVDQVSIPSKLFYELTPRLPPILPPISQVVATTFGQLKKNHTPWELEFLTMNVVPNSECLKYISFASNTMLCAKGTEYNRTDRGSLCDEYGAPLVLQKNNRTLVGIYQTSRDTCDQGGPEVFTVIGPYILWIRDIARFVKLDSVKKDED